MQQKLCKRNPLFEKDFNEILEELTIDDSENMETRNDVRVSLK